MKSEIYKWMACGMHLRKPKVCLSVTGSLKLLKNGFSILHMAYAHIAHGNMHADTRAWKVKGWI